MESGLQWKQTGLFKWVCKQGDIEAVIVSSIFTPNTYWYAVKYGKQSNQGKAGSLISAKIMVEQQLEDF